MISVGPARIGGARQRDETAGAIARQIISIRQGNGDGFNHPEANTQCSANDNFWVVSHSQGAQQMMFIAGNAIPGSPNYNTAYGNNGGVSGECCRP